MGWMEEYNALKKKRIIEAPKKVNTVGGNIPSIVQLTGTPRQVVSAPVKTALTSSGGNIPTIAQADGVKTKGTVSTSKKSKKSNKNSKLDFFQKGAFKDGYDFGDITKTILGTAGDAGLSAVKGVAGLAEGLVDLVDYGIAGGADLLGYDDYADMLKEFTSKSMVDMATKKADEYLDKYSVLGKTSDSVLQGVGQVGGILATGGLAAAGGMTAGGVSALTTSVMGLSGMGSAMGEAYQSGATDGEAVTYGAISGAADALSELMFGGMGKAVNALGFSKGLSSADDILAKAVSKKFNNQIAKNFAEYGIKASAEGLEEVVSGVAQAMGKKMTYMSEKDFKDILEDENLLEQFIVGSVTSGMIQSGIIPGSNNGSLIESNKNKTDFLTGATQNEQAVIKREIEKRIAEEEADGTKLTKKQKSDIEAQVERDLEKGYLSIDTIEEVLGGDDYNRYRSIAEQEDAIYKEYDELGQKPNATLKDQARYAELTSMIQDFKDTSQRDSLKAQISENVFNLAKGDRLVETYNEKARRGQTFEADLSKYDTKQQSVIQKAIDSGVLNNTNRTHELVDLVAKISADKGVLFDFTNNENLKNSGFAVDGKFVNGYVTKDGITLNVESSKYLDKVVGHEITHVLEGTEFYEEFQKTIVDYAVSKGEYDSRLTALKDMYKDVQDADVYNELTADLVGDYLFTDENFINNLSTNNRNVFQKIYDEVKYLCRVATAGSKEARELERVKRAFEKAYKADSKDQSDTKYSLTGVDENGVEVYETSDDTKKLTRAERKDKLLDIMKNQYAGRTAKFTKNGEVYYAFYSPKGLNKGVYGDSKSDRKGYNAKINIGADGNYIELAENALYTGSSSESGKSNSFHQNAKQWDYYVKTIKSDGEYFDVLINVKDTDTNQYVYDITLKKNQHYRHDTQTVSYVGNSADSRSIVPQNTNNASGNSEATIDPESDTDLDYESPVKYSVSVTDKDTVDFLENQEHITTYKAMVLVDGKLYPPMASKVKGEDGKYRMTNPRELGEWQQATEDTTNIKFNDKGIGYYDLKKDDGGTVRAAYNPYEHSSNLVLNDQFEAAYKRDNLVTVECEIPVSEMSSGYKAEYAKDATGVMDWHSGVVAGKLKDNKRMVYLSRYLKATRILSDAETAAKYKEIVGDTPVPFNVVSPGLLSELEKVGVNIDYNGSPQYQYQQRKSADREAKNVKYSISDTDGKQLSKEQQDYFKDSKLRDENGNLKVMYHGSQDAGFHVFDSGMSDDNISFFFTDSTDVASSYSGSGEIYEARTIRTTEDFVNFLSEIGEEDYEVTGNEESGYFVLDVDGDTVANSDNLNELYTEFCDYMGFGYGDANYKVYLNLKNPLVIDAEGRNWDNISREFSQEFYDKYQTLTADEKNALTQIATWEDIGIFRDELNSAVDAVETRGMASVNARRLASAYYKLFEAGNPVSMYDLFSIASDNFSEESLKNFAVNQLKTRDYAQRAKEQGYDGVILNNVVDYGQYGGDYKPSTVAIAFDSNQIKSTANAKPTGKADIRYSLSEDTAGRKLSENQKEYFKDSKVVDENGNLKVMYHGTPNGDFTVFKDGTYFTDSKEYADVYQSPSASSISTGKVASNPKTFNVYLDIKKPFDITDAEARNIYINDYIKGGNALGINPYLSDEEYRKIQTIDWTEGEDLRDFLIENEYDYDGLVLDEGGVGGFGEDVQSRGKSYVVFSPEQVKNIDNQNPTSDKDIRYSLSSSEDVKKAESYFGTTYKISEAGYLLTDGKLLDFSGRHEGGNGGYRSVDHRDISDAFDDEYGDGSYSGGMVQFMQEGNIRLSPESGGINLSVKPNKEQLYTLDRYISNFRGEVILDIDDANGNTVVSIEYPKRTYSKRIINDITNYFDNGVMPKQPSSLGQFRYSLSNVGDADNKYQGRFKGVDLKLDIAPTMEAPMAVAENATTYDGSEMFPDDQSSPEVELDNLNTQLAELEDKMADAIDDDDALTELINVYTEVGQKALDLERELSNADSDRINSLTDAPPEMEAPFYGESKKSTVDDPFYDRDIVDVGKRNVKAYQYENPEVKPFFRDAALGMLGDLRETTKGERWYNDELYYESGGEKGFGGTTRNTTSDIAELLDQWHYTYDQIEKGLNAIIEDDGAENNAASKRIEFMLNDRLLNGYTDVEGRPIPKNQEYINILKGQQAADAYNGAFDSLVENADQYAPVEYDIAPVAQNVTNEAPTMEAPVAEEAPEVDAPVQEQTQFDEQMSMFPEAEKPKNPNVAKVLSEEPKTDRSKNKIWDIVKEKILDNGMVFEDLSYETGNHEIQAKWNFIRNADQMAQRLIGNGTQDVKSLTDIKKEVDSTGKTDKFYLYLYHKHNIDRMTLMERFGVENKSVFGETVDANISRDAVNGLEKNNPEFKELAKDVYKYNSVLRDLLVENDVISPETAKLWEKMYPHYVPIRRVGMDGLNINVPLDSKHTGVNAPVKRATGGSNDILPLFDTMADRTLQTYKAITKNSFGLELKDTLNSTVSSEALTVDGVIDSLDAPDGLLQEGKNGENPTFTVFENGERVTFEITDEMYEAMKPRSKAMSYTNKALNIASSLHRAVLTQYNPMFMATNAIKDAQDVLINSQHPLRTYLRMPQAYFEIAKGKLGGNSKWYTEYVEHGGEQNTYFDRESKTFKEDSTIKKAVTFPLEAISEANDFIEMAPRLAEYIESRSEGRSIERSMLDAARVTTNFAAGGEVTKFINRNGFTFFGASVNGAVQQARNIREANSKGFAGWAGLAGRFALAGLPTILLNNLLWDDDEEYEELSDYVKQSYYVVGKTDEGRFIRIPKGRTVSVIQGAIDQVIAMSSGDDEADLGEFMKLVMDNIAPNNPLDNNILAPVIQAAKNTTWYGEDLVPSRLQKLPEAEQYDEKTDKLSKWLGEKTDISPYKINYLLNQYGGIISDVALPYITPRAESGDDSAIGKLLAPMRDKFTTDPVINNQNVGDFYDKADELEVIANSMNATEEDQMKSMYMDSVSWEVSDLYKQKREIQNSDLSDSEKYNQARDVQDRINSIMRDALNGYDNVSIDGMYSEVGNKRFNFDEENQKWYEIREKNSDGSDNYFYQKEQEVTKGLGISPGEYWNNRDEYNYAYDKPEQYQVARACGGYEAYKSYTGELYDIKADKDKNGKSINGSRKKKVLDWVNNLDADYGTKIILFKNEYNADDTYNYDIIDYLNGRDDISYQEMETILKYIGFEVDSEGNISW